MSNILDYIKWRGDLSFSKSPMNEVDGMIFANLCYLNFDAVLDSIESESIAIKEYTSLVRKNNLEILRMLLVNTKDYDDLLYSCSKSTRFRDVKLSDYLSMFDPKLEMQFAAITFELDDKSLVVAFRGTDDTIAGWKEDFNMGFLDVIPSQAQALNYLNRIYSKHPDRKLYLLGHSKGGNLAIYSAVKSPLKVNSKIAHIYNYDGPGFRGDFLEDKTYLRLTKKITSIVPESSIIGMLLERKESELIAKSNVMGGFYQHDGFSWEVIGTKFVTKKERNIDSQIIDKTLKSYLYNSTSEQRMQVADALSKIFKGYESYTLTDLTADKIKVINRLSKSYDGLDKHTKDFLTASLRLIFSEGIKAVRGNSSGLKLPVGLLSKK
ncbi:MAG: DUF2974 domain-containing protein [Clostridiales bacterium]|nr:DUF2974 domain-containing protein [Clostridiales bacterium]